MNVDFSSTKLDDGQVRVTLTITGDRQQAFELALELLARAKLKPCEETTAPTRPTLVKSA